MKELTIGLLSAPELPEKMARRLAEILPDALKENIDKYVHWNIEIEVDSLTGAAETANEITEEAEKRRQSNNWNYVISVTDLPIISKKDIVLAISNQNKNVAQVSIPAFGLLPMEKRLKETIIQMVKDLHNKKTDRWT
ncbi:hypothetical protein [Radiobacillus deserti]|uniref:Uncharacterized protein n=1 Tax=Radiobacillus deserti TaxID=2594883 RepID=A0A516KKQ0_9BACI|nr:hypothetical protein [Radiobacillus deserti]QDP41969.1 hypothetical protein FN924_18425 [Radiobacillus deserti]